MTTPDPAPGSSSTPDDATTSYDAEAARAQLARPDPAPWPTIDPSPWPPAGAPSATPPPTGAVPPPVGSLPPAGSVPPPGAVPPGGAVPSWGPPPGSVPPGTVPPLARRTSTTPPGLVAGVILVIIGAALLLSRVVEISLGGVTWPLWIVIPGLAMLVGSFFIPPKGGVGLAVPGAIVTIVGLVLWVQDAYDLYATWAYAWALVAPTGPGVGMFLYGVVHRDGQLVGDGLRTMLVGIGLFLGFALFFEGVLGLSGEPIPNLDQVLPYAVIGLGAILVALSFVGSGRREDAPRRR